MTVIDFSVMPDTDPWSDPSFSQASPGTLAIIGGALQLRDPSSNNALGYLPAITPARIVELIPAPGQTYIGWRSHRVVVHLYYQDENNSVFVTFDRTGTDVVKGFLYIRSAGVDTVQNIWGNYPDTFFSDSPVIRVESAVTNGDATIRVFIDDVELTPSAGYTQQPVLAGCPYLAEAPVIYIERPTSTTPGNFAALSRLAVDSLGAAVTPGIRIPDAYGPNADTFPTDSAAINYRMYDKQPDGTETLLGRGTDGAIVSGTITIDNAAAGSVDGTGWVDLFWTAGADTLSWSGPYTVIDLSV